MVDDGPHAHPAGACAAAGRSGGDRPRRRAAGRRGRRRAGDRARAGCLRVGRRGRGGAAAGRGPAGPAARGQPGPGRGGVRRGPGDGVAVGPGAGRRRGRRAGPGPAGAEGRVKADPGAGGPDRGTRRGWADAAADRRGDRGVDFHRPQRAGPGSGRGRCQQPGPRSRWGRLGEGAGPVFTPGARYPLAGLLLALPALADTGLLECAREVCGRLRNGYCGLAATLLALVFLALAGEPRAEGATRVPPGALGRVLGLDRAPEVKTIRRKLGELVSAGKAADLVMALARRHAAARPGALGFLHADGHARACFGTRKVQKTRIARLKFPAPATEETWVTDQDGDPVFMVIAEPSDSLAGELKRLLPDLRRIVGEGRRVTVCFDRGGWSPALFADIAAAGFDLLTWRKGPAPDLPEAEFTTNTCTDDRGREHQYDLADTTITLDIHEGPRKGQKV